MLRASLYNICSVHVNVVANDAGYFKEELTPVTVMVKRKEVVVDVDEHPKPQTTLENLAKLPTVFKKDGVVTAGSSSVSQMFNEVGSVKTQCSKR